MDANIANIVDIFLYGHVVFVQKFLVSNKIIHVLHDHQISRITEPSLLNYTMQSECAVLLPKVLCDSREVQQIKTKITSKVWSNLERLVHPERSSRAECRGCDRDALTSVFDISIIDRDSHQEYQMNIYSTVYKHQIRPPDAFSVVLMRRPVFCFEVVAELWLSFFQYTDLFVRVCMRCMLSSHLCLNHKLMQYNWAWTIW